MRIMLINPPNAGRSIPEEEYGITAVKEIFRGEPLALEVIAGNLDGHEVAIVDLKVEPDALWQTYAHFKPDLIGFTGVTCEANSIIHLSEEIRKSYHSVIVVGGHHATCDPAFFNRSCIDFIVTGLGKKSFRELVDSLEQKKTRPGYPVWPSPILAVSCPSSREHSPRWILLMIKRPATTWSKNTGAPMSSGSWE